MGFKHVSTKKSGLKRSIDENLEEIAPKGPISYNFGDWRKQGLHWQNNINFL